MHVATHRFVCHVEVAVGAIVPAAAPELGAVAPDAVVVTPIKIRVAIPRLDALGDAVAGLQGHVGVQVDVADADARPGVDAVEGVVIVRVDRAEVAEVGGVGCDAGSVPHAGHLRQGLVPAGDVVVLVEVGIGCVDVDRVGASVAFLEGDGGDGVAVLLGGVPAGGPGDADAVLCPDRKAQLAVICHANRHRRDGVAAVLRGRPGRHTLNRRAVGPVGSVGPVFGRDVEGLRGAVNQGHGHRRDRAAVRDAGRPGRDGLDDAPAQQQLPVVAPAAAPRLYPGRYVHFGRVGGALVVHHVELTVRVGRVPVSHDREPDNSQHLCN